MDLKDSRAQYGADCGFTAPFNSVFFGGGTPSLLSAAQVEKVLDVAARHYGISHDAEVTLEANPGTVNAEQLSGYRKAGVNRLSLGVQSFDDQQLKWLGRRHDSAQAIQAVTLARNAGFDRLSIDLMFSLPNQGLAQLQRQLQFVKRLSPEHLSVYGLTIEDQTPFAQQFEAGLWQMPDDELYRESFLLVDGYLTSQGYGHYEISNYAKLGEECRHNLGYWQRQPYLGVGAGAHTYFERGLGERWSCENSLVKYFNAIERRLSVREKIEVFDLPQAMFEAVYLSLRCKEGLDEAQFERRYGRPFVETYAQSIEKCSPYLSHHGGRWSLSNDGWLLYNYLIEKFL